MGDMKFLTHYFSAFALLALVACSHQSVQANLPRATESAPPAYKELLSRYVTPRGVRYDAWHKNSGDMEKLRTVVDFYANTLPPSDSDSSLAWHLNAYNAWILHNILKKYPTKGPLDGETLFFHGKRIIISGKKTSFDHLEQKIIRPTFKEPRIHFAVNCASESCPPLHTTPFTAANLDADLEFLTRQFINKNPQGVVPDGDRVKLSKIFEWYAEDFGGKKQLLPYINRYREQPVPAEARVEFLDYSWKLNAVK